MSLTPLKKNGHKVYQIVHPKVEVPQQMASLLTAPNFQRARCASVWLFYASLSGASQVRAHTSLPNSDPEELSNYKFLGGLRCAAQSLRPLLVPVFNLNGGWLLNHQFKGL